MLLVVALVVLYWLLGLGALAIAAALVEEPVPLLASLLFIAAWPVVLVLVAFVVAVAWSVDGAKAIFGGPRR